MLKHAGFDALLTYRLRAQAQQLGCCSPTTDKSLECVMQRHKSICSLGLLYEVAT